MYWPDNSTHSGISDNIDNNTSVGLPILGWISMKFVV